MILRPVRCRCRSIRRRVRAGGTESFSWFRRRLLRRSAPYHTGGPIPLRTPATAAGSTEEIPEPEDVSQNVAEIGECIRIKTAAARTADAGMAMTVVQRALLRVAQYRIGFGSFLESVF